MALRTTRFMNVVLGVVLAGVLAFLFGLAPQQGYADDPALLTNNPSGNNPPAGLQEDINVTFTFEGTTGEVVINNKRVQDGEAASGSGVVQGTTDSTGTNTLSIASSFGEPKMVKVVVNGTEYPVDPESDQFSTEIPGASSYTITITASGSGKVDRTIIWANVDADHSADNFDPDMLLEHGKGAIIGIYGADGTKKQGEIDVDENGMGWATADPGDRIVFQFVPDYGYQLTQVLANGQPLEPQEATNQYTFIMPDANVHFAAQFSAVKDSLKTAASAVEAGTVDLGSNVLAGGSGQLSVENIELSEAKIEGFENAAGAYSIDHYLNINFYNVFYKGKNDADDVWSEKIEELDNEAIITIQLAEGVNGNEVVIVHNVHDGESYEIIPIESYDPATNTITFKTKSFSGYAIASKTTKAAPSSAQKTQDKTTPTKSATAKTADTNPGAPIGAVALLALLAAGFAAKASRKA